MEVTVFAKKRTSKEGKKFYTYLTKLTRKDGTTLTTSVRFTEACGAPKSDTCPINIVLDKGDCNLSTRSFVNPDTGEEFEVYTLWVNKWQVGSPYVDTSMDDFI